MNHPDSATPPTAWFTTLTPALFVLLWSTGFIGARFGLPYAEPLTFLSLRYAAGVLLLGGLALLMRAPWPRNPATVARIGLAGLLIHAGYLGGVFVAIAHGLSPGLTALVVGLQPLLTAVLSRWLGEPVSRWQWLGLLLGLAGVALVVWHKVALGQGDVLGQFLPVMVALLSITLGTVYQKRACPVFDLRTGAVIQFAASLALTFAAACVFETQRVTWSGEFVFALGWLTLVLSLGAIALLNRMIALGAAVKVASLFYLTPPITALIAWAMFGDAINAATLAGLALAASGVLLARRA